MAQDRKNTNFFAPKKSSTFKTEPGIGISKQQIKAVIALADERFVRYCNRGAGKSQIDVLQLFENKNEIQICDEYEIKKEWRSQNYFKMFLLPNNKILLSKGELLLIIEVDSKNKRFNPQLVAQCKLPRQVKFDQIKIMNNNTLLLSISGCSTFFSINETDFLNLIDNFNAITTCAADKKDEPHQLISKKLADHDLKNKPLTRSIAASERSSEIIKSVKRFFCYLSKNAKEVSEFDASSMLEGNIFEKIQLIIINHNCIVLMVSATKTISFLKYEDGGIKFLNKTTIKGTSHVLTPSGDGFAIIYNRSDSDDITLCSDGNIDFWKFNSQEPFSYMALDAPSQKPTQGGDLENDPYFESVKELPVPPDRKLFIASKYLQRQNRYQYTLIDGGLGYTHNLPCSALGWINPDAYYDVSPKSVICCTEGEAYGSVLLTLDYIQEYNEVIEELSRTLSLEPMVNITIAGYLGLAILDVKESIQPEPIKSWVKKC